CWVGLFTLGQGEWATVAPQRLRGGNKRGCSSFIVDSWWFRLPCQEKESFGSGTVWWSRHSCLLSRKADKNVCSTKLYHHWSFNSGAALGGRSAAHLPSVAPPLHWSHCPIPFHRRGIMRMKALALLAVVLCLAADADK